MGFARKFSEAAGLVVAPWLYLAGRALSSPGLEKAAMGADPQYLRALRAAGRAGHSSQHIGQFQIAALLSGEATADAAERIKRMMAISESQLLQDIFCAVLLHEKREGFFVEVGVGSGRAISNTYMLERYYGWNGVLCEPNRSSHRSISACRQVRLDRRAAASTSGAKVQFQEMLDDGEHSRVVGMRGHTIAGARMAQYEVETVTLDDLLSEVGAPYEIDYLSLDTEGSEIDILKGLDMEKFKIKVMTIEHNFNPEAQGEMRSMLAPFGYRLVFPHISGFDAWFVHSSVESSAFRAISGLE